MNQLAAMNAEITMSSREIAELVEKRPDNVKRTIETLAGKGVISQPQIEDGEKSANGVVEKLYMVNKRDSYVIVAQLSPEFTARLVDRWQELEAQAKPQVPQTYAAALLEAGRLALELEQKNEQLAIAAPKAEFVDRYVDSSGTYTFRQVAKTLGIKENVFREFLLGGDNPAMYRLAGRLTPYAHHVDAGRFIQRTGVADNEHSYTESRFTAKGVEWIAGEMAKAEAKKKVGVA